MSQSFKNFGLGYQRKSFQTIEIKIQWTLEIVDLDLVDSLVLVDKIVLTNYGFMKLILTWNSGHFAADGEIHYIKSRL